MDLSNLESRQLKFNITSVPLIEFVKSIEEKYILDFKTADIVFHSNCNGEWIDKIDSPVPLTVPIDIKQLDRVFANLLSNALSYTPKGGKIELNFNLSQDNKNLMVEVADTGTGIPEEDQTHIFERFYKVAKARQASHKSNGLGLAIAKEIVEYHGGQIWVKSQLGIGSSFFFTLPVQINEDIRRGETVGR